MAEKDEDDMVVKGKGGDSFAVEFDEDAFAKPSPFGRERGETEYRPSVKTASEIDDEKLKTDRVKPLEQADIDRAKQVQKPNANAAEGARTAEENAKLAESRDLYRSAFLKSKLENLGHAREKLYGAIEEADNEGRTADKRRLEDQLSKVRTEEGELSSTLRELSVKREPTKQEEKIETKDPKKDENYVPPLLGEWLRKNTWYNDPQEPGDLELKKAARRIGAELTSEGKSMEDADFYTELNKRLTATDDGGEKRDDDKKTERREPAKKSHVEGGRAMSSGGGQRSGDGGKRDVVRMGAGDIERMRTFRLDPENPDHVKRYASEMRNTERTKD